MNNNKLDKIIRNFLLNESEKTNPSVRARILHLEEVVSSLVGKSLSENRKLEIIREQLSSLKRDVRRLEERNTLLEEENKQLQEKLTLLEENKEG